MEPSRLEQEDVWESWPHSEVEFTLKKLVHSAFVGDSLNVALDVRVALGDWGDWDLRFHWILVEVHGWQGIDKSIINLICQRTRWPRAF